MTTVRLQNDELIDKCNVQKGTNKFGQAALYSSVQVSDTTKAESCISAGTNTFPPFLYQSRNLVFVTEFIHDHLKVFIIT